MAPTPTANTAQGRQAPPPPQPFRVGVQATQNTDGYSVTQAIGTTAVQLAMYNPSPNAWLRGIFIQAACTGTNTSAAVAFAADGPWNVYSVVQFNDTQGRPIIGPISGFDLFVINKYGGYGIGDPRASAVYTNTTGAHAGGGSFEFVLYLPLEVVSRDALGVLENKNAASPFQLQLTVNTLSNVYSTAPDGSASLVTTLVEDGYWAPQVANAQGQPLAQSPMDNGTTQYWVKPSFNMASGTNLTQLTGGLGCPIRMILFENYSVSSPSRANGETDWPDPATIFYKGATLRVLPKNVWLQMMCQWYNLTATTTTSGATTTTFDVANGLENGVFAVPFNIDFDLKPGSELRRSYLSTNQGDQFQLSGSFGAACTLYELTNYVASGDGNPASLRG